jgi:predicted ATP-dependent protease
MLKMEVVEAIREGKFHIFPVETIDEAIKILTGMESGERGRNGEFKKGTVNYLVDKRLKEFTEEIKKVTKQKAEKGEGNNEAGEER